MLHKIFKVITKLGSYNLFQERKGLNMNEEEIMKKFNEAVNGPSNVPPPPAYKVSDNTNLNTVNLQTSDPLNINIPSSNVSTNNINTSINNPNINNTPVNDINNNLVNDINKIIPSQDNSINNIPNNMENPVNNTNITNNDLNNMPSNNNISDFTEASGNNINNNDVNITPSSNVNYVRKNVQKKKATIKITDEVRFAIIIVGILLVFVFFFPDIIKFFRKIFLGLNR